MIDDELHELPDVPALRVLAPPAGGLARVRETIDREAHAQARPQRWWLAIAPLAVAAVLLILLTGRPPRVTPAQSKAPQAPASAVAPVADPSVGVAFYSVASQPSSHARAEPSALAVVDSLGTAPVALVP